MAQPAVAGLVVNGPGGSRALRPGSPALAGVFAEVCMLFSGKDRSGGRHLFSSRWFLLLLLTWALPSTPEVRTVSVGVYQNSPKVFIDEQGRPAGFFIELLEGIAAREGWRLHYVPCEWKRCLELLEEGEIQLMPDVAFSRERERRFAFGREVALSSWSVFYTDPEKPLFSLKALDGEKVAVVRNSIQYQALRELVKELGIRPVYLETDDMGEVFRLVHTGQARAGLVNTYFGRRNAGEFGLVESSVLVRPTLLYIAANPAAAPDLLPAIDNHLRAWKQDRDSLYHAAVAKWLVPPEQIRLMQWLTWGVALALGVGMILLSLVALFRSMLKRRTAELERKKRHLDHLAHHDPLTGLPNRLLFFDRLEQSIHRARREGKGLALLFLDLDQFKQINDTFGHALGDELLKQVANRLRAAVRESDTVARIGGDEFAVIMEALNEPADVIVGVQHLSSIFHDPFTVDEHRFSITFSIGISIYPQDGGDAHTLLRNADTAMFRAKAAGRNTYQLYDETMTRETVERARLEGALRQAVESGSIEIHYQPQVVLADGRLAGFEVLMRWRHAELGEVPPDRFLPLAEEIGLMGRLGEQVLRAVCAQLVSWREEGLEPGRLAVNLSCRQLRDPGLLETVSRILEESGCPPSALEFEVTENFVMRQVDLSVATMRRLRSMGIELAIDDFGTGYSSLAYLKALPLSRLKIDRSFIAGIPGDDNDLAIVRAVVALGRTLGLKVLAEGVETEEQRGFLLEAGCDEAQGYLFGRPVAAEQATELLRAQGAG